MASRFLEFSRFCTILRKLVPSKITAKLLILEIREIKKALEKLDNSLNLEAEKCVK